MLTRLAILMIRFYQRAISPWLGANCRFQPTCSQYTLEAIKKYGPIRGILKGAYRILRCHPWNRGGYDPP
jgi:putative membrane protein insertion efficiency factor